MDASYFKPEGLFWLLNDIFTRIAWKCVDLYIACNGYWLTVFLAGYFQSLYYFFNDCATRCRDLDTWAKEVINNIKDRLRYGEVWDRVRALHANIRYVMDDPDYFIRETIGRAHGWSYDQYSTWSRILYWLLWRWMHGLWLFYIDPWGYVRDLFFGRITWFRDFLDHTEDWLRGIIGRGLGLTAGEYATLSLIPRSVLQRYFPFLYQLFTDPDGTIRERIGLANGFQYWQYGSWYNLIYWLLNKHFYSLWLFYIDPDGYIFERLDSYINRSFASFANWTLNLIERLLLYWW